MGIIAILAFSVIIGSFIVFSLRVTGVLFLPRFGFPGLRIFLFSFPWILGLIVLVLVLLIWGLAKKSSLVYSKPLLYSILAIFILVLLGSFLFEKTRVHNVLFKRAQDFKLPLMGEMYRGYGLRSIENVFIGEVREVIENSFSIKTREGKTFQVVFSGKTRFPFGKEVKVGDLLIVMGREQNGTILASGIRKIENTDNLYLPPMNYRSPKGFRLI